VVLQWSPRIASTAEDGVAVVKFRVNNGGGNGTGCFEIKVETNTSKLVSELMNKFPLW